jgi:hypothetical protein
MPEPVKTIDVTPSPAAYVRLLTEIITRSSSADDRAWAAEELVRIQPAVKAGRWGNLTNG